jgi:hypothetical protein
MISQAGDSNVFNVSNTFGSFHKVKNLLNSSAATVEEKTQQAKASLIETTDKAVDRVSAIVHQAKVSIVENVDKTKDSLEQTLHTTGQIKSTTSDAIQTAIGSSLSDWLVQHPAVLRVVQLLAWGTNHPILSLVILLFALAIAFSLIKAIGSIFEKAWLSILQAPLKLGQFIIIFSSQSLGKFGSLIINPLVANKTANLSILPSNLQSAFESDRNNKHRLLEISNRLEEICKEQNELLKEAAAILNLDEKAP